MSHITKRKYVYQEMEEYVLPSENQQIVKVIAGKGNNLHEVMDAKMKTFLVSMPCKFRKCVYVKRGSFVIIDPIEEGDKVRGEIAHILLNQHIRHIQEEGLWPEAFGSGEEKSTSYIDDDLMPPSDSEDEDLGNLVVNANRGNQLYEEDSSDEEEEEEDEEQEEEKEEEEKDDKSKEVEDEVEKLKNTT